MPQTFSPNSGYDLAGFLAELGEPATAVLERTTMQVDFRVEFKCESGRHYGRQMRGRGKKRTAKEGNFIYLGKADMVAQRGGYYEQRWIEYQFNHSCHYQ